MRSMGAVIERARRAPRLSAVVLAVGAASCSDIPNPPPDPIVTGAVVTSRNDNARTGANLVEHELKPENVRAETFGLLFSRDVDGKIFAQPLYVPGVTVADGSKHDIVYVTTQHDTVYAFDAKHDVPTPLWSKTLGNSVPSDDINTATATCADNTPEIGITATPTIDLTTKTLYVLGKLKENDTYVNRLFALDLGTGEPKVSPVDVEGRVPGTAADGESGSVAFDNLRHQARPGLLLDHGVLYAAFGSHCDIPPWHGWVFAFDATTLRQKAVWNTSPDGQAGGIWQSGGGMSADSAGDVYFVAGNGTYRDGSVQNGYGETVGKLRLKGGSFGLVDWYTPHDVDDMNVVDADLASPAMLVPDTDLILALSRGKLYDSRAYALNRNSLGHFHSDQADETAQVVLLSDPSNTTYPYPTTDLNNQQRTYDFVYWNSAGGPRVYAWPQNNVPRAYRIAADGSGLEPEPFIKGTTVAQSSTVTGMLSLSANGAHDGIVWASINVDADDKNKANTVLYALDAETLEVLWHSRQRARDEIGSWPKFAYPTVGGGRVFMPNAEGQLKVFGHLPGHSNAGGPSDVGVAVH